MLYGELMEINKLSNQKIMTLFDIMNKYYDNLSKNKFISDLKNKTGIIILKNKNNMIQGFSTYKFINTIYKQKKIFVLYSGDTIIEKKYWGSFSLFVTFAKLLKQIIIENPDKKCYWFLITKGYKTYLFLPIFFNTFYPASGIKTPDFEKGLIKHLPIMKYKNLYNEKTGIIKANYDYLKEDYGKIPDNRKNNKHVNFFLEKNPYYFKGDELACLCEISPENFKKKLSQMIFK